MVEDQLDNNQAKPFTMYQQILRERLRFILDSLEYPLKSDVEAALKQRGKILCLSSDLESPTHPHGMWALLPLLVIRDLDPNNDLMAASSVAIAIECLICALDLLDDIEDGDQSPLVRQIGAARVLNVSTTLLLLVQKSLLTLAEFGISNERITSLITLMQEATLAAATGQHEDIVGEQQELAGYATEDCIRVARGKAGSLMQLAYVIGCVFVEAEQPILQLFAELGELLGIAHQLDNDSHDLYTILYTPAQETIKTDLERQKKTLPLVLAAQIRASQQLTPSIDQPEKTEQQKAFLNALHEGIIAAWGISLLYRERAQNYLQKIEVQKHISYELHLLMGLRNLS